MTDSEIIALLFARNEQGLRQTKMKYGRLLFSLSKNILSSDEDAAECENDTYFALWRSVPPKEPDPLSAFLCRITKNLSLKRLREKTALKRSGVTVPLNELDEAIDADELQKHLDAKRLGKLIDSFLDTLDSENRRLFVKRYWFSCDTAELADEFGFSENTVHKRLSRTRQKLKAYLIKEDAYHE
ncbi:MAG: RNA polymerase sigma factor [Acutalibacteraceae bacterium]